MRRVAIAMLAAQGWKLGAPPPALPKYVLISQHTSNWDGWFFAWYMLAFGFHASFVGKNSLFWGPLGPLLKSLGGIPVDRSGRHDLVGQLVDAFNQRDRLILGIAPEGTRRLTDHWKSGFYQVALKAKVPIVPGIIDYGRKTAGFGEPLWPTGDAKADMEKIRAAYAGTTPKRPEWAGPIRLKDEGV